MSISCEYIRLDAVKNQILFLLEKAPIQDWKVPKTQTIINERLGLKKDSIL